MPAEIGEQSVSEIGQESAEISSQESTIQRLCDHCASQSSEEEKEPLQAKLSVGEAGDKYEQEADAVARDVVEKINSPTTEGSVDLLRKSILAT